MNIFFRALNDNTRREILEMLKESDMTAGDIADRFNLTKPSISHHLDLLKQADLVTADKQGQFIYYSLNMTVMDEILSWFMKFQPAIKPLEELAQKPKIRLQVSTRNESN